VDVVPFAQDAKKYAANAHSPFLSREKLCYNRLLSSNASKRRISHGA
jgi:hypothetical protein